MELIKVLNKLKKYFLIVVIGFLLVTIYFKNNKITNLEEELSRKPKVEFIYNHHRDTVTYEKPIPVEVVKFVDRLETRWDTLYITKNLTKEDSSRIVEQFAQLNEYDDVLKDDSTAYVRLKEEVQYNSIQNRELIFEDRTPVAHITQPPKYISTVSIVGGIEAGLGGVDIGLGFVTKKNSFYKLSYNPYEKVIEGAVYVPIFNFKSK
jgi:c-di-AMP phosphodiesterase-like protein